MGMILPSNIQRPDYAPGPDGEWIRGYETAEQIPVRNPYTGRYSLDNIRMAGTAWGADYAIRSKYAALRDIMNRYEPGTLFSACIGQGRSDRVEGCVHSITFDTLSLDPVLVIKYYSIEDVITGNAEHLNSIAIANPVDIRGLNDLEKEHYFKRNIRTEMKNIKTRIRLLKNMMKRLKNLLSQDNPVDVEAYIMKMYNELEIKKTYRDAVKDDSRQSCPIRFPEFPFR